MATVEWIGGTDGNVATGTNYLGGVAPGVGDSVIARVNPVNPMTTGTFPNLVDFIVGPEYRGNIGNSAGQPTFGNVTGVFLWAGSGQYCKVNSTGTIAALRASWGLFRDRRVDLYGRVTTLDGR